MRFWNTLTHLNGSPQPPSNAPSHSPTNSQTTHRTETRNMDMRTKDSGTGFGKGAWGPLHVPWWCHPLLHP